MAEVIDFILELLAALISPANKYDKWINNAVKITGTEADLITKMFFTSLKENGITELKYCKLLIKRKKKHSIDIIAINNSNERLYSCNLKYTPNGIWKHAYI